MKAVFPCKGVIVVAKQNVDILANFYEGSLVNSKIYSAYLNNNLSVQVGNLNYLPPDSKIVLSKKAKLLTIQELNAVLISTMQSKPTASNLSSETTSKPIPQIAEDTPIEDEDIKNHPFFKTLKAID